MGYSIYNTTGIILSSFDIGEANKFFWIFTRELGLVKATAQSVRKIESKNRYGLQDFSISNISLVRGKDIWRITNVISQENIFFFFERRRRTSADQKFEFVANVFSLLTQLLQGEEKNEKLFDLIRNSIEFLKENKFEEKDLENLELLTKIRILYNLGHFNKNKFTEFLKDDSFNENLIQKISLVKKVAEKEIQKAMEETQL